MKDLKTNHRMDFEEILFENRNKEYGAYALRRESDAVLTKSLFVGLGLLASVSIIPLVINAFKDKPIILPTSDPVVSGGIYIDDVDPVVLPNITTASKLDFKEVDTRVPEPTRHVTKEEKGAATITERQDAVQGTKDNSGDNAPANILTTTTENSNNSSNQATATVPVSSDVPLDLGKINTTVDVQASYKGGIDAFRNEIMKRFPSEDFVDEGGAIRTTVTFVVERDGTISQITAAGSNVSFNTEAIKTIKKVKGAWEPAKIKGTAVRSYFKFPIVMNFE